MKKHAFRDFYLTSLDFHLDQLGIQDRGSDVVQFYADDDHTWITLKPFNLMALAHLLNILGDEKIQFTCGVILEDEVLTGLEICVSALEIKRLDERYSFLTSVNDDPQKRTSPSLTNK